MKNIESPAALRAPEVIRVHIAAHRIGCSARTVRRFIQHGKLPAKRIGQRSWAVLKTDVDMFRTRREDLW